MKNNFTAYCHISPNGKKYVGITSQSVLKRWRDGYAFNAHLQSAIDLYGWDNFQHLILAQNLSKEWACAIEQIFIRDWKLQDREFGYNISYGGEGGPLSEETKHKIGIAQRGVKEVVPVSDALREKRRQARLGYVIPVETREKISRANTGRHHTEEAREKMRQASLGRFSGKCNPMYGKHHTEVSNEKNRQAHLGKPSPMRGKHHTDGAKELLSIQHAGRVWVTNGIKTRQVHKSELNGYLSAGYRLGRK